MNSLRRSAYTIHSDTRERERREGGPRETGYQLPLIRGRSAKQSAKIPRSVAPVPSKRNLITERRKTGETRPSLIILQAFVARAIRIVMRIHLHSNGRTVVTSSKDSLYPRSSFFFFFSLSRSSHTNLFPEIVPFLAAFDSNYRETRR